jgi:Rps23 Pro-64 3,4-dihydroxylase Tpa1-like proline 4-hydroxylase
MSAPPAAPGRFLPFRAFPQWLDADMADALLDHAIAAEAQFEPAGVIYRDDSLVDPAARDTLRLKTLGPFKERLTARALDAKPELERAFGCRPFEPKHVEIEVLAYGEAAHFRRHIDTLVLSKHPRRPRVLTLVLYLHKQPQGFSGGAIRLYALDGADTRDIAPEHNLMVAFPSFAPHSVEPVACPSGRFADYRFAVAIWIHG